MFLIFMKCKYKLKMMNCCNWLLIILCFFINIYKTEDNNNKRKKEIYSLSINDYSKFVNDEKKFTFLVVYTHWCHWSNLLLEDLEKILELLKYDDDVKIAKINAAVNSAIIDKLNVYGYPSLFMIKKDKIKRYNGLRNIKTIVLWIYEHLDQSAFELSNEKKLNVFLELQEYNNSILFFISRDEKYTKVLKELIELCVTSNHTFCFYIKEKKVIDYFENIMKLEKYSISGKIPQDKKIYSVIFKNDDFNDNFYILNNELNMLYDPDYAYGEKLEILTKYLSKHVEPLVIKFSEKFYPILFSSKKVTLFIIYNDINELNKLDIINCAKKYRDITFSISGNKEVFEKRLLSELLIYDLKKPLMRIIEFKNNIEIPYKYKPINDDVEINQKNIEEFIEGYMKENKYFYRKSERALPNEYNNGYIKIVVADTYDEYVIKNDKNVLILFYAPWCGHCHKFEPIYREIGRRINLYSKKYKNFNNDILICKIDSANNEVYDISIDAYPSLYLYKKSDKSKPIRYLGVRSVHDIISWICKNTNTNIDITNFLNLNLDEEQLFENYEEL